MVAGSQQTEGAHGGLGSGVGRVAVHQPERAAPSSQLQTEE